MLHIANGDSVTGTLLHSGVPGDKLAFREDLTSGPTPAGLSTSEWLRLRADFLISEYDPPERDVFQNLAEQQTALESHSQHRETVLWFAHDFNCQIHLIYVLNLFKCLRPQPNKISLICIGEFPGIDHFICLGQLNAENLESLFNVRREVTDRELELAGRAWSAYCSNDPSDIKALLDVNTGALPFLAGALRIHLARFPSQRNGLGLIENWTLEQLTAGPQEFAPLFARLLDQYPACGLGDGQFWRILHRMSECREPLIQTPRSAGSSTSESTEWAGVSIEITPAGTQVLGGEKDFIQLNGIDSWLGGVHLQGGSVWRLDETGKLVRTTA